jgi:hypothetical protein
MQYMDSGGSVYLEGNDFGYYHAYDPLYQYFGCLYLGDGNMSQNVDHLYGQPGTILNGFHLRYMYGQAPDYYVDVIGADEGTLIFLDQLNKGRAVNWDGAGHDYRAIHSAFVFSAMIDQTAPDTKQEVMAAYLDYLLPEVVVNLEPQSPTVPQGGTLSYTARLRNRTDEVQMVWGRANVYLPNGNPFPGNPVVGPRPVTLNPGQQVVVNYSHPIPAGAPLGTFTYEVQVGVPPADLIDADLFEFQIVSP